MTFYTFIILNVIFMAFIKIYIDKLNDNSKCDL